MVATFFNSPLQELSSFIFFFGKWEDVGDGNVVYETRIVREKET